MAKLNFIIIAIINYYYLCQMVNHYMVVIYNINFIQFFI